MWALFFFPPSWTGPFYDALAGLRRAGAGLCGFDKESSGAKSVGMSDLTLNMTLKGVDVGVNVGLGLDSKVKCDGPLLWQGL
jgi:hypothetical protein